MNLQEIVQENKYYQIEKESLELQLKNRKATVQSVNEYLNMDDIKLLPYEEVKSIHKLLYWNTTESQRKQLDDILSITKGIAYPMYNKAHYYPEINEMDFISDNQKVELDKLLKQLYSGYVYTDSSGFSRLKLTHEQQEKVFTFLYEKGIVEKSYILRCGCGSRGDCDARHISQEKYDLYIKYLSMGHNSSHLSEEEQEEYWEYSWIESYCEYGNGGEINDVDEFKKKVKLFAYKNITKPDTSLDEV